MPNPLRILGHKPPIRTGPGRRTLYTLHAGAYKGRKYWDAPFCGGAKECARRARRAAPRRQVAP